MQLTGRRAASACASSNNRLSMLLPLASTLHSNMDVIVLMLWLVSHSPQHGRCNNQAHGNSTAPFPHNSLPGYCSSGACHAVVCWQARQIDWCTAGWDSATAQLVLGPNPDGTAETVVCRHMQTTQGLAKRHNLRCLREGCAILRSQHTYPAACWIPTN